jgi:hypothetical protein
MKMKGDWRAQSDDRPRPRIADHPPGEGSWHQPEQCLHPPAAGVLAQDLVGLPQLAVLPLQRLQALGHLARNARPHTAVDLSLLILTQSLSVCAVQPILAAIEQIAAHRDEG